MSTPFNNFLSGGGVRTGRGNLSLKSYSHATELYVSGNFKRAPKLGFIYFVSFDINQKAVKDKNWYANYKSDLGFLAKKIDLPKFKIKTETLNQYNRKTNVQTQLTYEPVSVEFHDDNSEITNGLWKNYYKNYFVDSNYGDQGTEQEAFSDTKYGPTDYPYGMGNKETNTFFNKIDIYVLHQGQFTQITLLNPFISSWDHDNVAQAEGTKVLQNKMTLVYDDVIYSQGQIIANEGASGYKAKYYDRKPGATGSNNLARPDTVFGPQFLPPPKPVIKYPPPQPPGASLGQLNKAFVQAGPRYPMPRPIGAGTFGLGQNRPGGFGLSGLRLWYGHGGLHGTGVINAGPIRLVLKK